MSDLVLGNQNATDVFVGIVPADAKLSEPWVRAPNPLPANTLPHDFAGGADLDRWWPQQSLRGLSMWTRVLLKILVHVDPAPVWAFFGRGPNGTMHVENGGVPACV